MLTLDERRMNRLFIVPAAVAAIGMITGCGTIGGRQYPSLRAEAGSTYYPATLLDTYMIQMGVGGLFSSEAERNTGEIPSRSYSLAMIPLSILDLPISLITDTVLLPADFARKPNSDQ